MVVIKQQHTCHAGCLRVVYYCFEVWSDRDHDYPDHRRRYYYYSESQIDRETIDSVDSGFEHHPQDWRDLVLWVAVVVKD